MKILYTLIIFMLVALSSSAQVFVLHYNRMFDGMDTIECNVYISVLPDRLYYLDTAGYDEVIITPTVVNNYRAAEGTAYLFMPDYFLIAAECCVKKYWYEK